MIISQGLLTGDKMDVIGLGALNCDQLYAVERIAHGGEEVGVIEIKKKTAGGSAANTIVALSRLGAKVGFVGILGTDREGDLILDEFRKEGVETRIRRDEGYTGAVTGFVDTKGERALYIYPGVNEQICLEDIDIEYLNTARFLHMSAFVNDAQLDMQREVAKQLRSELSFSPGMLCYKYVLEDLTEIIEQSQIMFLSRSELVSLVNERDYEEGSRILLNIGADIICVTLGRDGCYLADRTGRAYTIALHHNHNRTGVVDTTGAGDAFAAGFLYGLLHERGIDECGEIGNCVASFCIREYGARKGLPFRDDLVSSLVR